LFWCKKAVNSASFSTATPQWRAAVNYETLEEKRERSDKRRRKGGMIGCPEVTVSVLLLQERRLGETVK